MKTLFKKFSIFIIFLIATIISFIYSPKSIITESLFGLTLMIFMINSANYFTNKYTKIEE